MYDSTHSQTSCIPYNHMKLLSSNKALVCVCACVCVCVCVCVWCVCVCLYVCVCVCVLLIQVIRERYIHKLHKLLKPKDVVE